MILCVIVDLSLKQIVPCLVLLHFFCLTSDLEIRDHLQQTHPKEYAIYFHSDNVNEQEILSERADLDKKRIKAW